MSKLPTPMGASTGITSKKGVAGGSIGVPKPKKSTTKPPTYRKKLASVQKLANRYARLRDCFGSGGASCISCGEWRSFDELDGGHYLSATAQYSSTRFDERNIWGQCTRCNRFLHGNLRRYFRGLEKKLGRDGLDALEASAGPHHWTDEELADLRKYYNDKIKSIERGIDPRVSTSDGVAMSEMFSDISEPGGMPDVWEREERDLSQADG